MKILKPLIVTAIVGILAGVVHLLPDTASAQQVSSNTKVTPDQRYAVRCDAAFSGQVPLLTIVMIEEHKRNGFSNLVSVSMGPNTDGMGLTLCVTSSK